MHLTRVRLISPSHREFHRGQRSTTALKGRTCDRTVFPEDECLKRHLPAGPFHICRAIVAEGT